MTDLKRVIWDLNQLRSDKDVGESSLCVESFVLAPVPNQEDNEMKGIKIYQFTEKRYCQCR